MSIKEVDVNRIYKIWLILSILSAFYQTNINNILSPRFH